MKQDLLPVLALLGIDRIGNEGIRFLQYYGDQSCTAGRAAFLETPSDQGRAEAAQGFSDAQRT